IVMPDPLQNSAVNVYEHSLSLSIEMLLYLKTLPSFRFNPFLQSHLPLRSIHFAYRATACAVLVAAVIGQRQQNDSFKPAHDERANR
ncbi:MAG: hypothetical protein ACXVIR_12720, partial [Halobacteriota archaeon]